jgi:methylated-DNA-[protein]-cysteine S-methyltransferase
MSEKLRLFEDRIDTPVGELAVMTDADGNLRAVDWTELDRRLERLRRHYGEGRFTVEPSPSRSAPAQALLAYFEGNLGAIDAVRVATGGTDFQRAVWAALRRIPCGQTVSYGEIARRIGRPGAVRAVGLANNQNPIGIVVPCHRVIGASGSLTGYGGGIERKKWLLEHEVGAQAG